jgi:hypothetical protein
MADQNLKTLRDLIWYEYAKVVARSILQLSSTTRSDVTSDSMAHQTLHDLQVGALSWSDMTGDESQLAEDPKACAYCGSTDHLAHENLVPRSLVLNEYCPSCEILQAPSNEFWICRACDARKGNLGFYQFYKRLAPGSEMFCDRIPAVLEMKYLRTVYECLQCARCLDLGDIDGDGVVTVLDIDYALQSRGQMWNVLL